MPPTVKATIVITYVLGIKAGLRSDTTGGTFFTFVYVEMLVSILAGFSIFHLNHLITRLWPAHAVMFVVHLTQ
jgi:hypothetical protein